MSVCATACYTRCHSLQRTPRAHTLIPTLILTTGVSYTPVHHAERQSVANGAHSMAVQRVMMRRTLPTTDDGTLHRPRYIVQRDVQRPQSTTHAHRWDGRDDAISLDPTPTHYQW